MNATTLPNATMQGKIESVKIELCVCTQIINIRRKIQTRMKINKVHEVKFFINKKKKEKNGIYQNSNENEILITNF